MTISNVTKWLAAVVLAGYLTTLLTSHYALNTLKVGGELYNRIANGKDVVADILPPPAYLIEAYLEATLALAAQREAGGNPSGQDEIVAHVKRLKALESDYQTRHTFWESQTLEPELTAALLKQSYEPGQRFWEIVNGSLIPALGKADNTDAKRFYTELSEVYTRHRAAIDRTVELANAENERLVAEARRTDTITVLLMWAVGLVVLALIISGVAGVLLAILRPMNRINSAMRAIAAHRTDLPIPYLDRKDEIGEMAAAVEVFRVNAVERARLELAMAKTRDKDKNRQENLDKHLVAFKHIVTSSIGTLVDEVAKLRGTASGLLDKADEASRKASASETACATAAAGSEAVAAATEELNASIREIATQALSTSTIVGQTTERAESTDAAMTALLNSVGKIESVVTLIRQIAQHTNLLALNATIESARAGEAGKGFAVVAAEVKGLSEQTAKATEEIAEQIAAVQATTDAAASAVRAIGAQVSDIHHLASSVAAAVEQQQAATADIARNVNLVAAGSNAAAESSRFVTKVAEHNGAEANRLTAACDLLQSVSASVSDAVQTFINAVSEDLNDRREISRHAVDEVLVVSSNGQQFELRTTNVSGTGMKIAHLPGVKKDDILEVRIGSRGVKSKVIWVTPQSCGLHFLVPVSLAELVDAGLLPGNARTALAA